MAGEFLHHLHAEDRLPDGVVEDVQPDEAAEEHPGQQLGHDSGTPISTTNIRRPRRRGASRESGRTVRARGRSARTAFGDDRTWHGLPARVGWTTGEMPVPRGRPAPDYRGFAGLGRLRRPAPRTSLVQALEELGRRGRVRSGGRRAVELGLGQDLVARLVEDREELMVSLLLLERLRHAEPEIVGAHEAQEVADRRVLDLAKLQKCRLDVRLLQQAHQGRAGRQEFRGFLLVERIRQRLGSQLGAELAHELLGGPQGPGRDLTVRGLLPHLRDQFIEVLLVVREPLAFEDLGPLDGAAQVDPASG